MTFVTSIFRSVRTVAAGAELIKRSLRLEGSEGQGYKNRLLVEPKGAWHFLREKVRGTFWDWENGGEVGFKFKWKDSVGLRGFARDRRSYGKSFCGNGCERNFACAHRRKADGYRKKFDVPRSA